MTRLNVRTLLSAGIAGSMVLAAAASAVGRFQRRVGRIRAAGLRREIPARRLTVDDVARGETSDRGREVGIEVGDVHGGEGAPAGDRAK